MTNDAQRNDTEQNEAEQAETRQSDEEQDEAVERFAIFHFGQSNPRGPEQDDVPALLRRVADTVEKLGDVQIHDLVMHSEITSDGLDWPSITVYYADKPADDQP